MSNTPILTDKNTQGKVLDHLGLVMSTIDRLDLVNQIDTRIPLAAEKHSNTSMGQRVAAMILNGLGFVDNRLYMFPDFLKNKPVARLFGEGVTAEHFNDDALGRCLDKIYEYGITRLFSELAFNIGAKQGLLGRNAHIDTTTLSVHGEYLDQELSTEKACPVLTYGHSKDHRPDLKQIVLNLATTGAAGFPIWMEAHSGNASDQKELHAASERMQQFYKALKETPSFLYVADSAMYNRCLKKGGDLTWLSRVPERYTFAKKILAQPDSAYPWIVLENGYRIHVFNEKAQGVKQRFCLVSSEQTARRELKTFERRLETQLTAHKKQLWHLSCQVFACTKDAEKAIKALRKTIRYHDLSLSIVPAKKHTQKGRPKKGATSSVVGYSVTGEIVENTAQIEITRRQKGRFLLATNELDTGILPDDKLLETYKAQSKTESGFRFIKDNTFEVSSIFLKKPSRIAALMMVMTLCLMVYSVAQHQFRESLKSLDLELFDPHNKLTKRPTMKGVFKLFQGVHELSVHLDNHTQCLIINMSPLTKRIARCFGDRAVTIYALSG